MPRDGATIFSDLIGKLDVLRVTCDNCGRTGSYRLRTLLDSRGGEVKIPDWLDEIAADLTMDTYSHLMPNMQADAAAKLDAALRAAKKPG